MRDTELFAQTYEPLHWIAQGILPEGVGLLGGPEKAGKSWLVDHWAAAVSSGHSAFGRFTVEQGSVLVIAGEDDGRRLKSRFGKLYAAMGIKEPTGRLHLYGRSEWPQADAGGFDELRSWLEDVPDAKLVIIDPMSYFASIPDSYNKAKEFMKRYCDLAAEFHVHILMVQHTGRYASSTRGGVNTYGRSRRDTILGRGQPFADAVYVFLPDLSQGEPVESALLSVSGKDVTIGDLALHFDRQCGLWSINDEEPGRSGEEISQERRQILDILNRYGSLCVADIADLTGRSFDSAKHLLADMRAAGLIVKDANTREYMTPQAAKKEADPQMDLPFNQRLRLVV